MAQASVTLSKTSYNKRPVILSALFMGLGQLVYQQQWIKGVFYMLVELAVLFNAGTFVKGIKGLVSLGEPHPELPITQRDNSIFMLVEGIILVVLFIAFIGLYITNVKDTIRAEKRYVRTGRYPSTKSFVSSLADTSFSIIGLSPVVTLLVFFVMIPLLFSVLIAFTNYSSPEHIPPAKTVDWVGLQTFRDVYTLETWKDAFVSVALWTVTWAFLSTLTCYVGGMMIAIALMDKKIKFPKVFRTVYVLPYAVPSMLSLMVWRNMLNGTFGPVNRLLKEINIITQNIPWLSETVMARIAVIAVNMWLGFPYFMMLITGVLTSVSKELYEAASIDGANKRQQFARITLPLVLYQTAPLMIMSFSHNFNNFGAVYFLTQGFPANKLTTQSGAGSMDILMSWMYKLTYDLRLYNKAAVVAILIFIVIAPFAIYNFSRTKAFKEGGM